MSGEKVQSHPLFEMGFHSLTLEEIRQKCVDAFPLSTTREVICQGIVEISEMLEASGVQGILWIDGSFSTRKVNPGDADILLVCPGNDYDNGNDNYRTAVDLMTSNLKKSMRCETFVLFTYDQGHDLATQAEWERAWYLGNWGWTDTIEARGIITLKVEGARP